jgi:hypothetical protein
MGDHFAGGDRRNPTRLREVCSARPTGKEACGEEIAGPGGVDKVRRYRRNPEASSVSTEDEGALL